MKDLPHNRKQTLLIGLDGADWQILSPLLDTGRLPHFQQLISQGATAKVASLHPTISPILWNSIATGKRAGKHGVHGFTEVDQKSGKVRPVTSNSRRCAAIWDMLQAHEKNVHVINWFASHPADRLSGISISNLFAENPPIDRDDDWPLPPGTIEPPDVAKTLRDARVHPAEMPEETGRLFIPKLDEVREEDGGLVSQLVAELARAFSLNTALLYILDEKPWDFAAVYFRTIDILGHLFMPFHPPRMAGIDERRFDLFQDIVNSSYRLFDLFLGNWLALAGNDSHVVVVSDHGFFSGDRRPAPSENAFANPEAWHRDHGVLIMSGPAFVQDELIHGASLLDLTPTLLALNNLPMGRDMDGRVLAEAFVSPPTVDTIPTWEDHLGIRNVGDSMNDAEADALLNQFVALGYIAPPPEDESKAAEETEWANQWNLARDFLDASDFKAALPLLEDLHHKKQERDDVAQQLAFTQWRLGLHEEAEGTVLHLVKTNPEGPFLWFLQGNLAFEKGEIEEAAPYFEKALSTGLEIPMLGYALGRSYLRLENWSRAAEIFEEAAAKEPDNAFLQQGLAQARLRLRQWEPAAHAALDALALQHNLPASHLILARALVRLGRLTDAEQAFRTALIYQPDFPDAYRGLARLCAMVHGRREEAARYLKQAKVIETKLAEDDTTERLRDELRGRAAARLDQIWEEEQPPLSEENELAARQWPPVEEVTLVSGLPRSGTSLMMQILDVAGIPLLTDGKRRPDEFNREGYFEWDRARFLPRARPMIAEANGKAVKLVSALLSALPASGKYKVLFMERPVEEISRSQRNMLRDHDAELPSADHLTRLLEKHRLDALRLLNRDPDRFHVLRIPYLDLLQNPEPWIDRIRTFLDIPAEASKAMIAAIKPELHHEQSTPGRHTSPLVSLQEELAFNGQARRRELFRDLIDLIKPQLFVETGSYLGNTTAWLAEITDQSVRSCELNPDFLARANHLIGNAPHTHISAQDSRAFLRDLSESVDTAQPTFFYLDAHWYKDLPLREEIETIASAWKDPVIMIDDFQVPHDPGYGYDDYGQDKVLRLELIEDLLDIHQLFSFFPAAPSDAETGDARGCAVLSRNSEIVNQIASLTR